MSTSLQCVNVSRYVAAVSAFTFLAFVAAPVAAQVAADEPAPRRAEPARGIQIMPISLFLEPGQRIGSYTLKNRSEHTHSIEAEALSWVQVDNENIHEPADDVLATPPVFQVPAGGEQLVRVGITLPGDRGVEQAYRVQLAALPPAPEPGFAGVSVLTSFLVPMFVRPNTVIESDPQWTLRRNGDGTLALRAENTGNVHRRLAKVRFTRDEGGEDIVHELGGVHYVLAESQWEWTLEGASTLASLDRVWIHGEHRGTPFAANVAIHGAR